MDPEAMIKTIRVEVANYRAALTNSDHLIAAEELVDAVEALDSWLRGGGDLPHQWTPLRRREPIGA